MLGSLVVIDSDNDSVTIGFSNPEAAKLALYHEVMGAGKAKVLRQFMGVPPDQLQKVIDKFVPKINEIVAKGIALKIRTMEN